MLNISLNFRSACSMLNNAACSNSAENKISQMEQDTVMCFVMQVLSKL